MRPLQLCLSGRKEYGAAYEAGKVCFSEITMKDTLKYSLILSLICFIAGLLLSVVYAIAQPRIQQTKLSQEELAVKKVLPEAGEIEKIEKDNLVYYKASDNRGQLLGYIFVSETKGYSSILKAVVGVGLDGKIIAVKILEQNETPGIGSKITEESFLQRFKNKTKDGPVDTITGATISSSALIKSIQETMNKIFP